MDRMINGGAMFEIDTLDHWVYDSEQNQLRLLSRFGKGRNRYQATYDMSFCFGSIKEYHIGLSMILSSFWYKITAEPTAVVELIAATDTLYRKAHGGTSPAAASGVMHVDIATEDD